MIINGPSPKKETVVTPYVPTKNYISLCCRMKVVQGMRRDPYPLGRGEYNGSGLYEAFDQCSCCGLEVDGVIEVLED
jgi:hypothetical protein